MTRARTRPDRCFPRCLAAAMLVASACAPVRQGTAGAGGAAAYPPTFRYYGGATLAARRDAIASELGVDVEDLEVDPLGCVRTIVFSDAARVPVDALAPKSFSEREVRAWSQLFAAHRDPFCIPPLARVHVESFPGSELHVYGDAVQGIRLTKDAELGPDGAPRYFVRADGNMWTLPELPAARVEVASVVGDLVGRPFTYRMRARGTSPMCQGCPPTPPDMDLGSIEATATLEDFAVSDPMLQLVCGRKSTLELRRVLVVAFRPTVEDVTRRTKRPRIPLGSPTYRIEGSAVKSQSSFPTRAVDAVTGEAIPQQGWRFTLEPAHEEMCSAGL